MKKVLPFVVVCVVALVIGWFVGQNVRMPRKSTVPMAPPRTITGMHNPDVVVDVNQLKDLMRQDNVVVVDFSPEPSVYIPGAIWIDRTSLFRQFEGDQMSIATLDTHERVLGGHGIGNDTTIVVYDDSGNLWSVRALWQLRGIGHHDVRVLNGGTNAWQAAGEAVVDRPANPGPAVTYRAVNRVASVRADLRDVLDATNNPNWTIVDIRTQGEWDAGRVPGSVQFTYPSDVLNADGSFKTVAEYEAMFSHIPRNTNLIVYCLGGIRSSTTYLIFMDFLGWEHRVLNYDGSWWNYDWANVPVER